MASRRWLWIIFLIGTLHASCYALLVPPWQAPDEPSHMEYGCLMARLGRYGTRVTGFAAPGSSTVESVQWIAERARRSDRSLA